MCGTLKFEKTSSKIGAIVPFFNGGELKEAPWLGHHRDDNPKVPEKSKKVRIPASSYTETHRVDGKRQEVRFLLPRGKAIEALLIEHSNFPTGKGLFIITRDSTKKELQKCNHTRHPRIIPEGKKKGREMVQQELLKKE